MVSRVSSVHSTMSTNSPLILPRSPMVEPYFLAGVPVRCLVVRGRRDLDQVEFLLLDDQGDRGGRGVDGGLAVGAAAVVPGAPLAVAGPLVVDADAAQRPQPTGGRQPEGAGEALARSLPLHLRERSLLAVVPAV